MSTRTASFLALIGGFVFGAGCIEGGDDVAGDDSAIEEDPTAEVEQHTATTCLPWRCNGPYLSQGFHELNEYGIENAEGFSLLGLESGGLLYHVDVINTQIKATRPGFPSLTGIAVKGKTLKVKHKSGVAYNLVIDDVFPSVKYWPNVPGSGTTYAYKITYHVIGSSPDQRFAICENAASFTGENDTLGQPKWTVVLAEGDRWKADSKEYNGFDKDWFNVGCAGHVLGKIHMTHRSFPGGLVAGYANSVLERKAMIDMYIANYCGDGHPFTVEGHALSWTDWHIWSGHQYPLASLDLEARWKGDGRPMCLETPRLKGSVDPAVLAEFGPDIELAIEAHCPGRRPPTCSSLLQSMDPTKLEGAYFTSANP